MKTDLEPVIGLLHMHLVKLVSEWVLSLLWCKSLEKNSNIPTLTNFGVLDQILKKKLTGYGYNTFK